MGRLMPGNGRQPFWANSSKPQMRASPALNWRSASSTPQVTLHWLTRFE